MKNTKKLAISAMAVALGTVIMSIGAMIDVMDLTLSAVASLLVVLIYIEIGSPYTWLVWLATSLATAITYFGSAVWVEYLLVFGIYPLLKAYIERLPRWSWIPIKLLFVNAMSFALFTLCQFVLGIPFLEAESDIMLVATFVLINVAFIVYDSFISVMVRLYILKWRKRFERLFK
ncbi:MAG: hypothetical protein IJY69_06745 [Clostridia bacterium]|nr:hypothetical protein [Clostridia bacterium]